MHLISNWLNSYYHFIDFDCGFVINFCVVYLFSKSTQQSDFLKQNIIRKLTYKVKYISQINRGLIMFFTKSRDTFFKIIWMAWLWTIGKTRYKKNEHNQHSSVFKVLRSHSYSLNVTDSLLIPVIFIFLSCCEKAHNNKGLSREILKPCCESWITTRCIKPWWLTKHL